MYGNPSIIRSREDAGEDDGMKEHTCCFTGHRTIPTDKMQEIVARTEARVRELIRGGYRCFITGGAVGYDTLAAELLFHPADRRNGLHHPLCGQHWSARVQYCRGFLTRNSFRGMPAVLMGTAGILFCRRGRSNGPSNCNYRYVLMDIIRARK